MKFIVVQDQDSNDCRELKEKLLEFCKNSEKEVLVRIACHELEAWYFGDMNALSVAYGVDLSTAKRKKKYRIPDGIMNPKAELKRLLPEHQQISGARKIAPVIGIEDNSSVSFQMFVNGINGWWTVMAFMLHKFFQDSSAFDWTVFMNGKNYILRFLWRGFHVK